MILKPKECRNKGEKLTPKTDGIFIQVYMITY